MTTVSIEGLRAALERRDSAALAAFYRDDAVLRLIDRDHPPSAPRELRGRDAIALYLNDIYCRDMTHRLESGIVADGRLAFTECCTYPNGAKVFAASMIQLEDGHIAEETLVQAWDT
jgi:hypothetical protein